MNTRRRASNPLLITIVAVGLISSCTSKAAPAVPTPSKTMQKIATPTMGLCAFISTTTAGEMSVYGNSGPVIMFWPMPTAGGQTASCEFAPPSTGIDDLDGATIEVSIAPAERDGANQLTKLAAQPSASLSNINGNKIVWDAEVGVLYLEFSDRNPVYAASVAGTDSILTVKDKDGASAFTTAGEPAKTAPTWLVSFAEHTADGIASGRVTTTSTCPQCSDWGSGPMLIDDKGDAVPNPMFVLNVYYDLLDDTSSISQDSSNFAYLPSANQQAVFPEIARSMTVHPDCSSKNGCIYPEFAVTGWSSATARADGVKLGVDPTKVPNPTFGHGLPVYPSEFDSQVDVWEGTVPLGG